VRNSCFKTLFFTWEISSWAPPFWRSVTLARQTRPRLWRVTPTSGIGVHAGTTEIYLDEELINLIVHTIYNNYENIICNWIALINQLKTHRHLLSFVRCSNLLMIPPHDLSNDCLIFKHKPSILFGDYEKLLRIDDISFYFVLNFR
jgi:hypothetical protein